MRPLRTYAESVAEELGIRPPSFRPATHTPMPPLPGAPLPTILLDPEVETPSEMDLWARIARNAGRVPGLSVAIEGPWVQVRSKANYSSRVLQSAWHLANKSAECHRYLALKVVDAIERAGLESFWRAPLRRGIVKVEGQRLGRYATAARDEEHLAYLDCLGQTLEALPGAES